MRTATDDPGLRSRLAKQGVAVQIANANYLARVLLSETETSQGLIREANI
ncbi:MAG: hypothetical protein F2840_18490 [Actinobacteria bacterium]|uniref:Unannotated protein n=1 Tax=freshwater metagenome TaxID=449393 RepID=A0A6J7M9L2_9ZZZZ|nr:hypothetical protein [Actinomycetota bacterium]